MRNKEIKLERGNGTIFYKEERGCYVCQFFYTDLAGNRKRKSVSGKSEVDVICKRENFLSKNSVGEISVESALIVNDLVLPVIQQKLEMNKIQESSFVRMEYTLNIINDSNIGNIPVARITDGELKEFLCSIKIYADSTISKVYQLLSLAFDIACEKKIISCNPLRKKSTFELTKPKSVKATRVVHAYTVEEQNKIVEAISNYKPEKNRNEYRAQVLLELYTGMRMGEINALTLDDIDFKKKTISVNKTIARALKYQGKLVDKTKTLAGTRTLRMSPSVVKLMHTVVDNYVENSNGLIFYDNLHNNVITTNQVNNWFKRLMRKNSLPDYGQHALRHTYATRAIEAGVKPVVLSRLLGHTDIRVTLNTYCDVFNKYNDENIELFDKYLGEQNIALPSF